MSNPTTYTNSHANLLTFDGMRVLWKQLSATPFLVAVWCVDRPDAVDRLRALLGTAVMPARSFGSEVPMYEWYRWLADDADGARRPECFHTPGVYAQMSNGEYIKVNT